MGDAAAAVKAKADAAAKDKAAAATKTKTDAAAIAKAFANLPNPGDRTTYTSHYTKLAEAIDNIKDGDKATKSKQTAKDGLCALTVLLNLDRAKRIEKKQGYAPKKIVVTATFGRYSRLSDDKSKNFKEEGTVKEVFEKLSKRKDLHTISTIGASITYDNPKYTFKIDPKPVTEFIAGLGSIKAYVEAEAKTDAEAKAKARRLSATYDEGHGTKGFYPHSAEDVLTKRRLVDDARMEEKDVDVMSLSELVMHRRRLTYGVRVSPVLAALMDEIEEAKRNHRPRRR